MQRVFAVLINSDYLHSPDYVCFKPSIYRILYVVVCMHHSKLSTDFMEVDN